MTPSPGILTSRQSVATIDSGRLCTRIVAAWTSPDGEVEVEYAVLSESLQQPRIGHQVFTISESLLMIFSWSVSCPAGWILVSPLY